MAEQILSSNHSFLSIHSLLFFPLFSSWAQWMMTVWRGATVSQFHSTSSSARFCWDWRWGGPAVSGPVSPTKTSHSAMGNSTLLFSMVSSFYMLELIGLRLDYCKKKMFTFNTSILIFLPSWKAIIFSNNATYRCYHFCFSYNINKWSNCDIHTLNLEWFSSFLKA